MRSKAFIYILTAIFVLAGAVAVVKRVIQVLLGY
jgi:hypothetical protein